MSEDNAQNLTSDLAKITRERDYLQTSINRLEEELTEARESVEALEEQKTENLQLRETIDRLRLDLDELRTQARLVQASKRSGSSSLSRSASGSDSLPASLSRNLGRELARRLKDGDGDDGDETETEDDGSKRRHSKESTDSYEEETITTRRRLKRPTRKAPEPGASDSTPAPVDEKQAESVLVEVMDIGVQVDLPEKLCREIEVQTEDAPEMSPAAKRAALARDLAVDLDAVEAYIREKEARARVQAQGKCTYLTALRMSGIDHLHLQPQLFPTQPLHLTRVPLRTSRRAGREGSSRMHRLTSLTTYRRTPRSPSTSSCATRRTSSSTRC